MRFAVVLRLEVFLCTYSFCCIFCRQGVCINFNLSLFLSPLCHCLSFYTSLSLSHTHTLSLSLSHTHTLSLSVTHTHTLSLSHTHTLSLTHTYTLSLSLPVSFRTFLLFCLSAGLSIYLFIYLSLFFLPPPPNLPISLPRAYIIEKKSCFAARQKDKRKHTLGGEYKRVHRFTS